MYKINKYILLNVFNLQVGQISVIFLSIIDSTGVFDIRWGRFFHHLKNLR